MWDLATPPIQSKVLFFSLWPVLHWTWVLKFHSTYKASCVLVQSVNCCGLCQLFLNIGGRRYIREALTKVNNWGICCHLRKFNPKEKNTFKLIYQIQLSFPSLALKGRGEKSICLSQISSSGNRFECSHGEVGAWTMVSNCRSQRELSNRLTFCIHTITFLPAELCSYVHLHKHGVTLDTGRNGTLLSLQNELNLTRTGTLNDLKARFCQVKVSFKLSSPLRAPFFFFFFVILGNRVFQAVH